MVQIVGNHLRSCDIRKGSALTNLWTLSVITDCLWEQKKRLNWVFMFIMTPYVKGQQTEKAAIILYLRDGPYILWTCTHSNIQHFSYLIPTKFFLLFIPNRHVPSITTWKVSPSKFTKCKFWSCRYFDRLFHNASRLRYPDTTLSWFDPSSLWVKNPSQKELTRGKQLN